MCWRILLLVLIYSLFLWYLPSLLAFDYWSLLVWCMVHVSLLRGKLLSSRVDFGVFSWLVALALLSLASLHSCSLYFSPVCLFGCVLVLYCSLLVFSLSVCWCVGIKFLLVVLAILLLVLRLQVPVLLTSLLFWRYMILFLFVLLQVFVSAALSFLVGVDLSTPEFA